MYGIRGGGVLVVNQMSLRAFFHSPLQLAISSIRPWGGVILGPKRGDLLEMWALQ